MNFHPFGRAAAAAAAMLLLAGTSAAAAAFAAEDAPTGAGTESESPVLPEEFTALKNYQEWAKQIGYPQNVLDALGVNGINQDYYHTPAADPAYTSGRIVVGDSRCCQLAIYQQRKNRSDFASYAVWGGHYADEPMTETLLADLEGCFRAQIEQTGSCTVFFFATVNDYDFQENDNAGNIAATIAAAGEIAALSYEYAGKTYHPEVVTIGFDGGRTDAPISSIPQEEFNRYIGDYNEKLREAVQQDARLGKNAQYYTTVPEITAGNTGFIADGLHYSDSTLLTLTEYIAGFQMTEPGKATMFGTVMDPETVRDDAAMLAAGFTEDDLAAIRRGEDVTYAVRYAMKNARSYADLAKKSPEKKKIDAFFSGKEQHPEDSLLTSYYAVRKCGDAEPEVLEGIQNVPGAVALGLLPEQGDVNDFVANGSFTMLYLAGEQAVSVQASASANENGYVLIQFEYLGSGDYIVLYEANEEPEQEPDSPAKQEEKHTPAPKTGDAGVHTAMLTALAAAAAAFAAARRADTKHKKRKM